MLLNAYYLLLLSAILVLPVIASRNSSSCLHYCGRFPNSVPYPFGFSAGCVIPLTCNELTGDFHLHGFAVRNVTPDALLIDLPAKCNRSIDLVSKLVGPNYAMTRQNGLLLQNCSAPVPGCSIPAALLEEPLRLGTCAGRSDNVSCFSKVEKDAEFIGAADVDKLRCEYLYSAVVVDASRIPAVSLEVGTVELGWWLPGKCNCSRHSDCKVVKTPVDGQTGFRCHCYEGYEGDGFADGEGCRRVSLKCNPSKYMSGRCKGSSGVGVLIGGIIAGASLMAGLAVLCCYIRKRSTSWKIRRSTQRLLSEAAGSCTVPLYPYKEIERATNYFSEKQRLGTGAYGTVYAGKLHSDKWVAIKKIKHHDNDGVEQVMNEIKLLSSVSHPNLVRLLGCSIEKDEQILVYEFMPNGTLSQHLQRERGSGLPWTIRLTIAADTANAIAYLHSAMNPPIFHRDIKSSNILLDHSYNSKVADFGLSRFGMMEDSHISTAPQGTPGYLDPQYHQNFHLSDKSDVYSFGVVLVEIISGMKVVDFSRAPCEVNLAALAIDKIGKGCVDEILDPFLEPHTDAWSLSSVHKAAELAFRCLAYHRDMRPSMMEVAAELEQIKLSGWSQMDESIFLPSSASSFSSLSNGSENSYAITQKAGSGSRRVVIPNKNEYIIPMEVKSNSPVSVQDHWFSEQSSPSTNSLLGNVVQ
ncbi:wall-associated receptor kinase-like 14 [Aristolochia californica]|uniref:wall-associated receptor kinase-like 14 n=1 Tax=Aristolochia californica TaxID=171875 RepID=UPI0035E133DB